MASKKEVEFAMECDDRGIPWEYEAEKLPWVPPNKTRNYHPDFRIKCPDGYKFQVEYKGFLRMEDKVKMASVKEQYPDKDIRFVFQDAGKPVAGAKARKDGTKMSHAEWADKHGYIWAEGFMPQCWLKGKRFINRWKKEKEKRTGGKKGKSSSRKRYTNRPNRLRQASS